MIVKKTVGSIFQSNMTCIEKGLLDIFIPETTISNR